MVKSLAVPSAESRKTAHSNHYKQPVTPPDMQPTTKFSPSFPWWAINKKIDYLLMAIPKSTTALQEQLIRNPTQVFPFLPLLLLLLCLRILWYPIFCRGILWQYDTHIFFGPFPPPTLSVYEAVQCVVRSCKRAKEYDVRHQLAETIPGLWTRRSRLGRRLRGLN